MDRIVERQMKRKSQNILLWHIPMRFEQFGYWILQRTVGVHLVCMQAHTLKTALVNGWIALRKHILHLPFVVANGCACMHIKYTPYVVPFLQMWSEVGCSDYALTQGGTARLQRLAKHFQ
jgi:hypothetical protein